MNAIASALRRIGALTIDGVWRLGFATRFLLAVLLNSGQSLRRIHLTIRELDFSGVLSLLIIMVSGLFVGLVLGLQGYDILQRYGSADAVGVMVALSLLRELGPVIAALLFASRAGSASSPRVSASCLASPWRRRITRVLAACSGATSSCWASLSRR